MSWEELLALFNGNAELTKKYGNKNSVEEIRNFLLDPEVLEKIRGEQPEFAASMDTQRDVKLFTQCWGEYEMFKSMFTSCPSRYTREQAIETFKNPEFLEKKELGNKVNDDLNTFDSVSNKAGKTGTTTLSRAARFYHNTEDTPEALEENILLHESLFVPEGLQLVKNKVIQNCFGGDYSISAPKDTKEALEMNIYRGYVGTQMHTIDFMVRSDEEGLTLNPMLRDFYKYNKLGMEYAGNSQTVCRFYSNACSSCIPEGFSMEDLTFFWATNPREYNTGAMNNVLDAMSSDMPLYYSDPKAYKAMQELRKKGILGPETKYYKAFDNEGRRLKLEFAFSDYANGETVKFEKMSENERKQLDEALANPTILTRKTKPGALFGKGFMSECSQFFSLMDNNDSAFTWSSDEFAALKKGLKQMSASASSPTQAQCREFMRKMLKFADKYLYDKNEAAAKKKKTDFHFKYSDFTQGRIDAVTEIQKQLRIKLGFMAAQDIKIKTASRTVHEENQKKMGEKLDIASTAALEHLKNAVTPAFKLLGDQADSLPSETDPAFAALSTKLKDFNGKIQGFSSEQELKNAAAEMLADAEKYYKDNVGKSFDNESLNRFNAVKSIIVASKTAINNKLPIEARQSNATLKNDIAMRMAKAQLTAVAQGPDKKKAAEAAGILASADGLEKMAEKMKSSNAFVAVFSKLDQKELAAKFAEDPAVLLEECSRMSKEPLVDMMAFMARKREQVNGSMFADKESFDAFKKGPNPLNLSITRGALGMLSTSLMIKDNYKIDDIADPNKFVEEKLRYGKDAMKALSTGDKATVMRTIYDAMPKLVQYMNEKLTQLPSLLPPDIYQEQFRNISFAATMAKDIAQDSAHKELDGVLTPEETQRLRGLRDINDVINKPIEIMGKMTSRTFEMLQNDGQGETPSEITQIDIVSGIVSSKLFTMMKKDPEYKGLDMLHCMQKSLAPDSKLKYAEKIGTAVSEVPDLLDSDTKDTADYYLQDANQVKTFVKSLSDGTFAKKLDIKIDQNGNCNSKALNDSLTDFLVDKLPKPAPEPQKQMGM